METRLVYGFHPVREALRHRPESVRRVWVLRSRADRRSQQIEQLCQAAAVPVEHAGSPPDMPPAEAVSNGFLAQLQEGPRPGKAEKRPAAAPVYDAGLVVLLEDVQDPRNLGAILRVCEGAGVGKVLIRDRGSAPITPTVVKTSSGATEWLTIERVVNSSRSLADLKKEGYWTYGLEPGGSRPWEVDLSGPVVLCLGGEGTGLRRLTRESCDGLIGLPMLGRVESLNVATAAAAVLFEAVRQRMLQTTRQTG